MMQLDAFGHVRHCRIVRSIVPSVCVVSFEEFDELLESDDAISTQPYGRGGGAVQERHGVEWGGVESVLFILKKEQKRPQPGPKLCRFVGESGRF